MASIGKLSLVLTASADQLLGVIGKAAKGVDSFRAQLERPFKFAGAALKPMMDTFSSFFSFITNPLKPIESAFQSFFDLVGEGSQIKKIANIGKAAGRVGLDASDFLLFMKASGLEADELQRVLMNLQGAIGKQGLAAEQVNTPLEKFGLNLEALQRMSPAAQIAEISRRYHELPAGVEHTALALAVGGRKAAEFQKLLQGGPEGLAKLRAAMEKSGSLFTSAEAERAIEATKAVGRLKGSFEGIKTQLATAFAPLITEIADGLQSWIDKMGGGKAIAKKIANVVLDIALWIAKIGQSIERILIKAGGIKNPLNAAGDWVEGLGMTESEKRRRELRGQTPKGRPEFGKWKLPEKTAVDKPFFDDVVAGLQKAKDFVNRPPETVIGGIHSFLASTFASMQREAEALSRDIDTLTNKLLLEASAMGDMGTALEIRRLKERNATDAQLEGIVALERRIHLEKVLGSNDSLIKELQTPAEAFSETMDALNQRLEEGRISWELWGRKAQQATENLFSRTGGNAIVNPAAIFQGTGAAVSAIQADLNRGQQERNPFARVEELEKQMLEVQKAQLEELRSQARAAGVLPNLILA